MANNRAAIRTALKTILSGATTAGTNVYSHRETALWKSELPAILIYSNEESTVPESLRATRYVRTLQLTVEARVEATSNVDNTLDALLAEIETIIVANPSITATVLSTVQTNTEIRVESDGEKDIGVGVLTFECKYIA